MVKMGKVILGLTISLDGFINDRDGHVDKLYPDLKELRDSEPLQEAIRDTGAVVMGRNAFAMAGDPDVYAGNYEFQVPIFVLTHKPPEKHPKETEDLTFTFVMNGIESAVAQAKTAAQEKDVTIIGGASVAHQCLRAGLVDELEIDIMPVLLGNGRRLFEESDMQKTQLERLAVLELPGGRTHLKFRIIK